MGRTEGLCPPKSKVSGDRPLGGDQVMGWSPVMGLDGSLIETTRSSQPSPGGFRDPPGTLTLSFRSLFGYRRGGGGRAAAAGAGALCLRGARGRDHKATPSEGRARPAEPARDPGAGPKAPGPRGSRRQQYVLSRPAAPQGTGTRAAWSPRPAEGADPAGGKPPPLPPTCTPDGPGTRVSPEATLKVCA